MSANLEIIGLDKAAALVANLDKQVRFATANAINATLKDVQTFTIGSLLPSVFTLRSKGQPWQKPGGKFGFNIRPYANKATMSGTLGSQADWLKQQEAGGTKKTGGHRVAISAGARPDKKDIVPAPLKPRVLLRNAGDTFKTRTGKTRTARKSGAGFMLPIHQGNKAAIFTRDASGKTRLMYVLQESVQVKGVLHFEPQAQKLAEAMFAEKFATAWKQAVLTAR